jgi:hypothetical protein
MICTCLDLINLMNQIAFNHLIKYYYDEYSKKLILRLNNVKINVTKNWRANTKQNVITINFYIKLVY